MEDFRSVKEVVSKIEESLFQLINATIPAFERRIDELERRTERSIDALRKEFECKLALSDTKIASIQELENRTHESLISIRKEVEEKFSPVRDLKGPMDWLKAKVDECESIPLTLNNDDNLFDLFGYSALLSCFESGILDSQLIPGYQSITSIIIPSSVTVICEKCFNDCQSLAKVTFSEGSQLRKVGNYAFRGTGLREVCIPASVTVICESCFYQCKSLAKVTFCEGSQLKKIGNCAFCGTNLREVCIPATVEELGEYAFYECKSLAKVTFCEGSQLKEVGYYAFSETGLREVRIPKSNSRIEPMVQRACSCGNFVLF